jgi:hypothetical protein
MLTGVNTADNGAHFAADTPAPFQSPTCGPFLGALCDCRLKREQHDCGGFEGAGGVGRDVADARCPWNANRNGSTTNHIWLGVFG